MNEGQIKDQEGTLPDFGEVSNTWQMLRWGSIQAAWKKKQKPQSV